MDETYPLLTTLIKKDFQIEGNPFSRFRDPDDAQKKLTPLIAHLLDSDFARLLQAMYRIDISEEKLKRALSSPDPAEKISGLIIERELQKVKTRLHYR